MEDGQVLKVPIREDIMKVTDSKAVHQLLNQSNNLIINPVGNHRARALLLPVRARGGGRLLCRARRPRPLHRGRPLGGAGSARRGAQGGYST